MWSSQSENNLKPAKTSKELNNAIADDLYKQQVNDAKIAAMTDRVDYETFKNRVSVCHLKPVDLRKGMGMQKLGQVRDEDTDTGTVTFNPDGSIAQKVNVYARAAPEFKNDVPTEPPSNPPAFERDWRRNCSTPQDKYKYLLMIPAASYGDIFKVEMSTKLLSEVVVVLNTCCCSDPACTSVSPAEEAATVLSIMDNLTRMGRFSLSSKLISKEAKTALGEMFRKLATQGQDSDSIKAKWGIKL